MPTVDTNQLSRESAIAVLTETIRQSVGLARQVGMSWLDIQNLCNDIQWREARREIDPGDPRLSQ